MPGQESKYTARLHKMPSNRLRIQQFPLTIRMTLHPKIIADHAANNPTATPIYSVHSYR